MTCVNSSITAESAHMQQTHIPFFQSSICRYDLETLTVTPESPALPVVRPASSTVTAALRTHNNRQPRSSEDRGDESRLGPT